MIAVLAWVVGLAFAAVTIVSFVMGMEEVDRKRRRAYLGLCIYCGKDRHTGECS